MNTSAEKMIEVREEDIRGLSMRLCMLETLYKKDKDWQLESLNRAAKTLRRWLAASIPCNDRPPLEVLEALCDDLNTPLAITEMHKLAKTDGRGLFASMKLLGLIPGHGKVIDYDIVDEVKTWPIDAIPLVQWRATERH